MHAVQGPSVLSRVMDVTVLRVLRVEVLRVWFREVVLRVCPVLDGKILPQDRGMSNRDESPEKPLLTLVLEEYQGATCSKMPSRLIAGRINSSENALPPDYSPLLTSLLTDY